VIDSGRRVWHTHTHTHSHTHMHTCSEVPGAPALVNKLAEYVVKQFVEEKEGEERHDLVKSSKVKGV
jgi:hypothetical protein